MFFSKLVSVQVSLPYKDTDSTNARNVHNFRDLEEVIAKFYSV